MLAFVRRRPLMVVLAGAFALRAACGLLLQHRLDSVDRSFLIEGDAEGYWMLGRRLAAGEPYAVYEPPRHVLRMPGFPLVLSASMGVFGDSLVAARLLLAAVGTACCGLLFVLGRQWFDGRVGLVAAAAAAIAPVFVVFSVVILSETVFAAAMLLNLIVMGRLVRVGYDAKSARGGLLWAAVVGGACALASYVRPGWLLAAPLFCVAYVTCSPRKGIALLRSLVVVTCLLAALLSWAVRNRAVAGHWVWTTLWVGPSLYDGLNPAATGASDMSFFERDGLTHRTSEYEVDQHYRRQAWQFVREHPGRSLQLGLVKLGRFWKPWPNAEEFSGFWPAAGVACFFIPAVVLAGVGWLRTADRFWPGVLLAGPILYFSLVHMVFVSSLRYRLPAEYPLYVLAAAGACWLVGRIHGQQSEIRGRIHGLQPAPASDR